MVYSPAQNIPMTLFPCKPKEFAVKSKTGNSIIDNTLEKYRDDFMNGKLSPEQEAGYIALLTGPPKQKNMTAGLIVAALPQLLHLTILGIKWLKNRKNQDVEVELIKAEVIENIKREQAEMRKMFKQNQK